MSSDKLKKGESTSKDEDKVDDMMIVMKCIEKVSDDGKIYGGQGEQGILIFKIDGVTTNIFMSVFDRSIGYYVFSHEFAKKFWGEASANPQGVLLGKIDEMFEPHIRAKKVMGMEKPAWQHHLQQMVLEENPIDYLRKFVEP